MRNLYKDVALLFMLLALYSVSAEANMGHRAGAGPKGHYKSLPENSISALKASLIGFDQYKAIQDQKKFVYMEFDLQETADGEVVLFHDEDFSRLLPNNAINREALADILANPAVRMRMGGKNPRHEDLRIKHLTLEQLHTLTLGSSLTEKVATLEEFLEKSLRWNIRKPMTFEIKKFHSDKGRMKLLKMVKEYKDTYLSQQDIRFESKYDMDPSGISFLAFKKNLEKSFPLKKWCPIFRRYGFNKVYNPFWHRNICQ